MVHVRMTMLGFLGFFLGGFLLILFSFTLVPFMGDGGRQLGGFFGVVAFFGLVFFAAGLMEKEELVSQ